MEMQRAIHNLDRDGERAGQHVWCEQRSELGWVG
jgi:hypothetical protein